ncbi:MAG: single-stranded-DNA-specific exonuclease RecJ [Bacillota bacterium]
MQLQKRIQLNSDQQQLACEFAREYNVAPKVMNLIVARGIDTKEKLRDYLFASENDFSSPFDLIGMKEGVAMLSDAVENNKRIFIVCDYDCDGLSGLGIFMRYFADKKCEVFPYIPERNEGYGLNFDNIKPHLEAFKPDLLITCDLGITAVSETEKIKAMGIKVLITDHHIPKETIPNTVVINPKLQNDVTEFCGAGVVFKLMQGMGEDYKKYIELATVATVGDSVPLTKENRLIVKAGLAKMNSNPEYLIDELKNSAKITKFDSQSIAYSIVPRLNAGGRMGHAHLVKDLVSKKEHEYSKIKDLCEKLASLNEQRQEITTENFKIARDIAIKNASQKVLVLFSPEFFVGIMGIVASKITEEFDRPVVILTEVDGHIKGSARSVYNIDLHGILSKCEHLFSAFGGHKMACGLSLEKENLQAFINEMEKVSSEIPNSEFEETKLFDEEITPTEVSKDFIYSVEAMEPFGEFNPSPIFLLKGGRINFRELGKTGEHIVGTADGLKILGFRSAKYMEKLNQAMENNLLVNLQMDRYMGNEKPSSILRHVLSKDEIFHSEDIYLFDKGDFESASLENVSQNAEKSPFSTLVLVPSKVTLESLQQWEHVSKFATEKSYFKELVGKNTILVNPQNASGFELYENIYSLCGIIPKECGKNIKNRIKTIEMPLVTNEETKKISREEFSKYYKMLKMLEGEKYVRQIDIYFELKAKLAGEISKQTLFFTIDVLRELGILDIKKQTLVFTNVKSPLENSKIYKENQENI